jgi:hypothetical protein
MDPLCEPASEYTTWCRNPGLFPKGKILYLKNFSSGVYDKAQQILTDMAHQTTYDTKAGPVQVGLLKKFRKN